MTGRDPHEEHRVATPLELLFDLTLVVAFGEAGNALAHAIAEGHAGSGIAGFCFAAFAICWAWINYSWFASAFDTDDWLFRLLTMVQMGGVVILALGLPEMFDSVHQGDQLDNDVMVAGYVVMRLAMIGLWLRVAGEGPEHRRCARVYITSIVISQIGWCLLALSDLSVRATFALITVPLAVELIGPYVAERRFGGTPWHPHHIAERYGLLAIITLGEGIIGTVAAMSAYVHGEAGWTTEAALVLGAGLGLTFGMWWIYFAIPWGEVLHHHPERNFLWAHGHIFIFASIAATGAGLHVAQYYIDGHYVVHETGTVLSVAVPVAIFTLVIYGMYSLVMQVADPFHITLVVGTAALLVLAVVLAAAGASVATCLIVIALAPLVTVVGYEALGHRHLQDHLEKLRTTS